MPNVIGMEAGAAKALLDEAGLIPVEEEQEYRAAPGTVAEQSMEPETECTTGTEIDHHTLGQHQGHHLGKTDYKAYEYQPLQALYKLVAHLVKGESADKAADNGYKQRQRRHQMLEIIPVSA